MLVDDSKKLGMDSADPQNRFEWRGCLRERLVKQAEPTDREKQKGFKMDMIMIMIMIVMTMICQGTDLVPCLVFKDKLLLRYVYMCRYTPILYNHILG